jgi:hypothetical protein
VKFSVKRKTPPRVAVLTHTIEGETKRFAGHENPMVVIVPGLARLSVVRVQLKLISVPVQVENVRIAVTVVMYRMPSVSLPSVKADI